MTLHKIRHTVLVAAMLLPLAAFAQTVKTVEALYDKYSTMKGVEAHKVTRMMLFAARAAGQGDKIPGGMEGMKSLSVSDVKAVPAGTVQALDRDLKSAVAGSGYTLLAESSQEGHTIKTYAQAASEQGKVKNPLIYVSGDKLVSVIVLNGQLSKDEKFLQELTKKK